MDGERRPEERVRERLESFRGKLYSRLGDRGIKMLKIALLAVLILLVIYAILLFSLRVKTIEVLGDVTMFNEGEIIKASGISERDMLLLKSSGKIERTIKKNMPLAKDVKVKKSISGRVSIEIEFSDVRYYCRIDDLYYALDEDLRIMDCDESKSKYSAYGAVLIKLPPIRKPQMGEHIVFYDTVEETDTEGETVYEVKEEDFYDYATDFLKALSESGFRPEADGVILEEKFDITLIYANTFKIYFGDARDLDVKFRVLFEILSEGSLQYADKGIIDLSNPSKAVARADNTLDFSEFAD